MLDPAINIDNQEFYDNLMKRILRLWKGDYMKPTGRRPNDGVTIYTVFDAMDMFLIQGSLFELEERGRLNEMRKR